MVGKSQAMHMMTNKTRQSPQVDHLFDITVYGDPYFYMLHMGPGKFAEIKRI